MIDEAMPTGHAVRARMLLLLSKRSPWERERRELREIERGRGLLFAIADERKERVC